MNTPPSHCPTCGEVFRFKSVKYYHILDDAGYSEGEALDVLDVLRPCCRQMFHRFTHPLPVHLRVPGLGPAAVSSSDASGDSAKLGMVAELLQTLVDRQLVIGEGQDIAQQALTIARTTSKVLNCGQLHPQHSGFLDLRNRIASVIATASAAFDCNFLQCNGF